MKGRELEDIADICLLNASHGENTEAKKKENLLKNSNLSWENIHFNIPLNIINIRASFQFWNTKLLKMYEICQDS